MGMQCRRSQLCGVYPYVYADDHVVGDPFVFVCENLDRPSLGHPGIWMDCADHIFRVYDTLLFYIAVFFAGGALALMLLTDRCRRKLLYRFAAANLLSLGGILLCFPLSFWKIFGLDTDRGVQAYDALQAHENLWGKLRAYIAILGQQIFGNFLKNLTLDRVFFFVLPDSKERIIRLDKRERV